MTRWRYKNVEWRRHRGDYHWRVVFAPSGPSEVPCRGSSDRFLDPRTWRQTVMALCRVRQLAVRVLTALVVALMPKRRAGDKVVLQSFSCWLACREQCAYYCCSWRRGNDRRCELQMHQCSGGAENLDCTNQRQRYLSWNVCATAGSVHFTAGSLERRHTSTLSTRRCRSH
jgi:hypothetical protein